MVVSSATKAPAIGNDEAAASPQPLPPIVNAVAFASGSLQSSSQQDVLHWASLQLRGSGIDSHARDARILLRHVLGCTEEDLAGGRADLISADHVSSLQGLILRRQQGEPVAYIIGRKGVYGAWSSPWIDRRVLVPSPGNGTAGRESHLSCSAAKAAMARRFCSAQRRCSRDEPHPLIADVGTGSGAIAVSLAKNAAARHSLRNGHICRCNGSRRSENSVAHGVAGQAGFSPRALICRRCLEPVHVVVCNPPYIPHETSFLSLERDVRVLRAAPSHFPAARTALMRIGLYFLNSATYLLPGGHALFEIGFDMAERLTALAAQHLPDARAEVYQDLAGFDRILCISQIAPTA